MAADPNEQLGTGAPPSDARYPAATPPTGEPLDAGMDPAITTGATATSHPAFADGVDPNRSGSGGSGGPATPGEPPETEGSTGGSMDDLLGA